MEINLIIAKPLIKTQVYNGLKPTAKHILTKKLVNALFSKRWEPFMLDGIQYYKIYVDKTQYHAVIQEHKENNFLLVYFRTKDDPASENISNYQNYSSEKLRSNKIKVNKALKNNEYIVLNFEK